MDSGIVTIQGPNDAGPAERQQMRARAQAVFDRFKIDEITRIDVPGKGGAATGDDDGDAALRSEVRPLVPALQSGSLFGGAVGVLVVDAQNLLKAESEVVAELVATAAGGGVVAVFVASGRIVAPLGKKLTDVGDVVKVAKLRERDAADWLVAAARERRLVLESDGIDAIMHRFGSDIAAIDRALDQLASSGEPITADAVRQRFANRPDEPMWYYADAIAAGDVGEALRRLEDFLVHGHPLQLLAHMEGELRRRSLAAVAPDVESYAEWEGANPNAFPVKKAWQRRNHSTSTELRQALDAVSRADLRLKTAPESTHRVTMERLTVALCRWFGGAQARRR
ncbi:MAG: hypothetical protein KJN71_02015 [Acidimicrobiia bacterium]|nr:hypothetical protein [Acidimicrobiia bacterium]NNC74909.1 hypothetical protein [Acidimicrobiia bacterium]